MTKTFFVVSALTYWDEITVSVKGVPTFSGPLTGPEEGAVGYLPVFPSRAKAQKVYPDKEILEIRVTERAKEVADA